MTDDVGLIWREQAPLVLTALLRRSRDFDACEDAVQDALVDAARSWPRSGVPDDPRAWLVRVASRRLVDRHRAEAARQRRERVVVDPAATAPAADQPCVVVDHDDTLALMLRCAHPDLTDASRIALILRAVGGLSTAQIAAGFLVPEATMAQRISRAKATLRQADEPLPPAAPHDVAARLDAVRTALSLIFTEGHTTSGGDRLLDLDLAREAIRLTERLHRALPDDGETTGLLALMLLGAARFDARSDEQGELIPLEHQDRRRWDRAMIARAVAMLESTLPVGPVGPFQLQAAIAAVHAESPTAETTDWRQITVLYRMLDRIAPSPPVALNLAVAVGMADGPQAGLEALRRIESPVLERNHRFHAARAHLLERDGQREPARAAFLRAAELTRSIPEQRYLRRRAEIR
ncbi:MAG: sigma-70 family RNA polymerase sigma factor [Ilumatobacteraceae bacterium]